MKHEAFQNILRWICLLLAPLVLLTIELFHPANFTHSPGMYEYLSMPEPHTHAHKALDYFGPQWWFTLHMIQTPMMALVGIGMWLLVGNIATKDGALAVSLAWLARLLAFLFIIYYTVLDAVGGIGLGRTLVNTQHFLQQGKLNQEQLEGVKLVLNATWTDYWVGGVGSIISQGASWLAFLMTLAVALSRFFAKQGNIIALLLLIAAGWELQVSHAALHGPVAFGLLIIAALWLHFEDRKLMTNTG